MPVIFPPKSHRLRITQKDRSRRGHTRRDPITVAPLGERIRSVIKLRKWLTIKCGPSPWWGSRPNQIKARRSAAMLPNIRNRSHPWRGRWNADEMRYSVPFQIFHRFLDSQTRTLDVCLLFFLCDVLVCVCVYVCLPMYTGAHQRIK